MNQHHLKSIIGWACALIISAMVILTSVDVVSRYLFNAPIGGAFEITEILLLLFIYTALPLATLSKTHIEVEIWQPKSKLSKTVATLLATLSIALVFTVFAIEFYEHAIKYTKRDSTTDALGIALQYAAYFAMFGASFCILSTVKYSFKKGDHNV